MKTCLLALIALAFSYSDSSAGRIQGGHISIRKVNGLTYAVMVTLYSNSTSSFSGGSLDFGDHTPPLSLPTLQSVNTGGVFGIASFSTEHTYAGNGFFVVSFSYHNLPPEIINMEDSEDTPFYIESAFNIDFLSSYLPPDFPFLPVFEFPQKGAYSFGAGIVDATHIYRYQLKNLPGINYTIPPGMSVSEHTGLISWDTHTGPLNGEGQYFFIIRVTEYDMNNVRQGWADQAFGVLIQDPQSSKIAVSSPPLDSVSRVVVKQEQTRTLKYILSDSTETDTLAWLSKWDPLLNNCLQFSQYDSAAGSKIIKVGVLTIKPVASVVRDYPYLILLRGSSVTSSISTAIDRTVLLFTNDAPLPVLPESTIVTGLQPEKPLKITVYPNPAKDYLHIDGGGDGVNASFVNFSGQVMLTTPVQSGLPVDVSGLSAGVYILKITQDCKATVVKFVVTNH